MKILFLFIQILLLIAIAPFLSGLIKKIKNTLRMRKGASVFQPYYNLQKLFGKEEVISENTSWIFRITPFIVMGCVVLTIPLLPLFGLAVSLNYMGDFLLIIFILALGRFFLALAGLDAASAFGGMGSSREMFISALVEPVALLAVFAVSLNAGSTSLQAISNFHVMKLSSFIAVISLFIVTIVETSRLPIDNQETHLELTMIHEAMVLEYSGRSLALLEWASYIKQVIFFTILSIITMPFGSANIFIYFIKIAAMCLIIAVIEILTAKMRLFRVVDFLSFSLFLSVTALIISSIGL